jgi:hypothetical protein
VVTTARNPYVFVVGCPRSGTTLLQRMLDSHPQLAVSNDPHFIPFAPRGVREGHDVPVTPDLVDWLLSYRTFGRLELGDDEVREVAAASAVYSELVERLYDLYARKRGKQLAGEKTPRYVRFLPHLHSLFPLAKVVHLIRDGREVALSMLDWAKPKRGPGRFRLWQAEPVAVGALSWHWHVTTGRRDAVEPHREVRYHELIERPEAVLRELADFLELSFATEMLEYHRGRRRSEPGLSAKDAWLPPTSGLRDWRTQMSEPDVELFEAIAGDLLSELGYERAFPEISPAVEERAARCRAAWETELLARRGKLASRLELTPR